MPTTALVHLAEADAFRPGLQLARREVLWAIKALRDEPLPLFAAAAQSSLASIPELNEPTIALRPLPEGGEVVEDYRNIGLSLRAHPLSFLRDDLAREEIVTCAETTGLADGKWAEIAGLVLVRQRPGSAEGVVFVTIEDETGIANLVVWPDVFETFRRVILSARMLGVYGRVQKEGEVVHIVVRRITDYSSALANVGYRNGASPEHDSQIGYGNASLSCQSRQMMADEDMVAGQDQLIRIRTRDFR